MPYKNKQDMYNRQKFHRDNNFKKMWDILLNSSCKDCKINDPRVLEFDHLYDKKFDIARAVASTTRSWNLILKEIEKCEIVCANCHVIRTQERGNHKRFQAFVTQRKE